MKTIRVNWAKVLYWDEAYLTRIKGDFRGVGGGNRPNDSDILSSFNNAAKDCFEMGYKIGRLVKIANRYPNMDVASEFIIQCRGEEKLKYIVAQIGELDNNIIGEYSIAAPVIENLVHSTIDRFIVRPILFAVGLRLAIGENVGRDIAITFRNWATEICLGLGSFLEVAIVLTMCTLIKKAPKDYIPSVEPRHMGAALFEFFSATLIVAAKVY